MMEKYNSTSSDSPLQNNNNSKTRSPVLDNNSSPSIHLHLDQNYESIILTQDIITTKIPGKNIFT